MTEVATKKPVITTVSVVDSQWIQFRPALHVLFNGEDIMVLGGAPGRALLALPPAYALLDYEDRMLVAQAVSNLRKVETITRLLK